MNAKRRGCQPGGDCKNGFGDMYYTDSARDADSLRVGGHKNGLRHGIRKLIIGWRETRKGRCWKANGLKINLSVRFSLDMLTAAGIKVAGGCRKVGMEWANICSLTDLIGWLSGHLRDQKQGYAIYYDAFSDVVQESYFHGKMGSRQPRHIDPAIFDEKEDEVRADGYSATSEKKSPAVSAQESASNNVEADASVRSTEKNKKSPRFSKKTD